MNANYEPSISIIIPTLNRLEKLKGLIDSLVNVNWLKTELIIVDDSTQNYENEIRRNKNYKINYIHRGQKLGVSSARNIGAKIARGKYLIFLDDDDEVSENWIEDFHNSVDEDYDLVFCNMKRIDFKNPYGIIVKPTNNLYGAQQKKIVIPGAFMLKKEIFDEVGGYDERLLYAENTELFYRIDLLDNSRLFIDKTNFIYYPSVDGGSKNLKNMIDSIKIILEKHNDSFPDDIKHLYNQIIAVNYMRFGDRKNASNHLYKAITYKPFKFNTYGRLLILKLPFLASYFYKLDFRK